MVTMKSPTITQLIIEWRNGNDDSLDQLIVVAYDRLHKCAKKALADSGSSTTTQTTELLHEFYCYLKSYGKNNFENSAHFFAIAAFKLRQLLQERYRRASAKKRDFGARTNIREAEFLEIDGTPFDVLIVSDAFEKMKRIDESCAQLMALRVFWEFSVPEILAILDIGESTYYRRWSWVKAWIKLYCEDFVYTEKVS